MQNCLMCGVVASTCNQEQNMPSTASLDEPLLSSEQPPSPHLSFLWAVVSLFATTVGAGVLSVPISFAYCGSSYLATLLLLAFCIASAASLRFIAGAARRTGAKSYLSLGTRCFGDAGSAAVTWSLFGLLGGAVVQMIIIVVDLLEMLLIGRGPVGDATASRPYLLVAVVLAATPLCLPHEILQLRFTSSLSVIAILFTCACIVGLALTDDGEGYSESEISAAAPASVSWVLAMPIFSLAYCSQFNVLDISHTLPKPAPPPSETASEVWIQAPPRALSLSIPGIPTPPSSTASLQNEAVKRNDANDLLSHVVHLAMCFAFLAYAIVGIACYTLLGESALNYPNVLTAFGEVPLVALGSAAIACVNFLKLPLVLLPLRALLLEAVAGVTKPIGFIPNLVLTAGILAASGLLAAFAGNLAIAFQLAGSTAGVMVCFVLPGAMHVASLRIEGARDIPEPEEKDYPWLTEWKCRQMGRSWDALAGWLMVFCGLWSGAVALWVTLS